MGAGDLATEQVSDEQRLSAQRSVCLSDGLNTLDGGIGQLERNRITCNRLNS